MSRRTLTGNAGMRGVSISGTNVISSRDTAPTNPPKSKAALQRQLVKMKQQIFDKTCSAAVGAAEAYENFRSLAGDAVGQRKAMGGLSFDEFRICCNKCGVRGDKMIFEFYKVFDINGSGLIDFPEFSAVLFGGGRKVQNWDILRAEEAARNRERLVKKAATISSAETLRQALREKASADVDVNTAFKHFTKRASTGRRIDLSGFVHAIQNTGLRCTKNAAHDLFAILDPNMDGVIDYHEFVHGILGDDSMLTGQQGMMALRTDHLDRNKHQHVMARKTFQQQAADMLAKEAADPLGTLRSKLYSQTTGLNRINKAYIRFRELSGIKGNFITANGFQKACKALGIEMGAAKARREFSRLDRDGSGAVDFKEFATALFAAQSVEVGSTDHQMKAALDRAKKKESALDENAVITDVERLREALAASAARDGNNTSAFGHFLKRAQMKAGSNGVTQDGLERAVTLSGIRATRGCIKSLFKKLDPSGDGKIQYTEFVTGILGDDSKFVGQFLDKSRSHHLENQKLAVTKERSKAQANVLAIASSKQDALKVLKDNLQQAVGGPGRLLQIFKKFRQTSGAKGNKIAFKDFEIGLKRAGVRVQESQARAAFNVLDVDRSGTVEYGEFVKGLFNVEGPQNLGLDGYARQQAALKFKEQMSYANAANLVKSGRQLKTLLKNKAMQEGNVAKAFVHFSKLAQSEGKNAIDLEHFRTAVKMSTIVATPEAVESLFHELDPNNDGAIDYQEFVEGIVGNDAHLAGQYFGRMRRDHALKQKLQNVARQKQLQSAAMAKLEIEDPLEILKNKLLARLTGHNVLEAFKRMRASSGAQSNDIQIGDFTKMLFNAGLGGMTKDKIQYHFSRLDPNGDGSIDYREFCSLLFGRNRLQFTNADKYFAKQAEVQAEQHELARAKKVADAPVQQLLNPQELRLILKRKFGQNADAAKEFVKFSKASGGNGTSVNLAGFRAAIRAIEAENNARTQELAKFNPAGARNKNPEASDTAIDALFALLDPNGDGRVEFNEFSAGIIQRMPLPKERMCRGEEFQRMKTFQRVVANQARATNAYAKVTIKSPLSTLREKLSQMVSGPGTLLKAFKAFKDSGDATGSNGVNYLQFKTAMYRCGLFLPRKQAKEVFKELDVDHSGEIDFTEFVAKVFPDSNKVTSSTSSRNPITSALEPSGTPQNSRRVLPNTNVPNTNVPNTNVVHTLMTPKTLRKILRTKFSQDRNMMKAFVRFSNMGQKPVTSTLEGAGAGQRKGVNAAGLVLALSSMNVTCQKSAVTELFNELDPNHDGTIDYSEFVKGIMGDDSQLVGQQMGRLAKDHVHELRLSKARQRAAAADQAVEYFQSEVMAKQNGGVLSTLRTKLTQMVHGPALLLKAFKKFRSEAKSIRNSSNSIKFDDFCSALKSIGMHFPTKYVRQAFDHLDTDGSGELSYNEFVRQVFGTDQLALNIDDYGQNFAKQVQAVEASNIAKGTVTSVRQLRSIVKDKIRGHSSNTQQVFNWFRKLGGKIQNQDQSNTGITLLSFEAALGNIGIHANQTASRGLYKDLTQSASTLTYDAFVRGLIGDESSLLGNEGMLAMTTDHKMVAAKQASDALGQQQDVALAQFGVENAMALFKKKIMESNISASQLIKAFRSNQIRSGRRIGPIEFNEALKTMGLLLSKAQSEAIIEQVGANEDNDFTIDYRDFVDQLQRDQLPGVLPLAPDHCKIRAAKKAMQVSRFVDGSSKKMNISNLLASIQARAMKASSVLAAFKDFTRASGSATGTVSLQQFYTVCERNGIRADKETVKQLFKELDMDMDGRIDYNEFVYGILEGKVQFPNSQQTGSRNQHSPSSVRARARQELGHTSDLVAKIRLAEAGTPRPGTAASYSRRPAAMNTAIKVHLAKQRKLLKSSQAARKNRKLTRLTTL